MNLTRSLPALLVLPLALVCLGASGSVAGPPPAGGEPAHVASDPAEPYLRAGLAHARRGNWPAAIAAFNDALEIAPGSGEALLFRGRAEAASKDYDAALRSFAAALPLLPHEATLYQAIGEVHAARGEAERAADAFAIAANIHLRHHDRGDASRAIARLREVQPGAAQLRELDARLATVDP